MAGAFSTVLAAEEAKPSRVVPLPIACWAQSWTDKPACDVEVGLRVPAEAELVAARAEAAQKAWRVHPSDGDAEGRLEAYNGFVMARVVARGTTEPTDARLAYFRGVDGGYEDDRAPLALTPAGIEYLYNAIDLLSIEESPVGREASHAEVTRLLDGLRTGSVWEGLDTGDVARVRRLLRHVAEVLGVDDATVGAEG